VADGEKAADRPPGAERRRVAVLVATALAVQLLYWWVISAGTFTHFQQNTTFLDELAEGFRHGHLHLSVEPPPALATKADPRDPANSSLWYWDASYYKGHYYLYWGPVPALLLAAVKVIFRISSVVGDQHPVFWLTTLELLAGTLLIERAGRRLYARPPLTLEMAAVVALGCANPILYNLSRPAVYEAAIVGGQAFLLLGIWLALEALSGEELRPGRLAAAGACWAAAFGCRISVAPAVAVLALATVACAVSGRPERFRRLLRAALALGAPLVLALGSFLLYNRVRFESWLDFGQRHQLNWIDLRVGARFITTNLYAYLRRPPILSCRFPFAYALSDIGARAFPPGTTLPENYFVYEQVAGVAWMLPWCWMAPLALYDAARGMWRTRTFSPRAWIVSAAAIVASTALVPDLVLATATNRYLGDIVGATALLGAFGAFTAWQWLEPRRRWRWVVVAVALPLALATALLGLALGMKGQYAHFPQFNPPLYDKLVRHLSLCRGAIPPEPK
jgi:hypothetical protein